MKKTIIHTETVERVYRCTVEVPEGAEDDDILEAVEIESFPIDDEKCRDSTTEIVDAGEDAPVDLRLRVDAANMALEVVEEEA